MIIYNGENYSELFIFAGHNIRIRCKNTEMIVQVCNNYKWITINKGDILSRNNNSIAINSL